MNVSNKCHKKIAASFVGLKPQVEARKLEAN
jgi:hypothetical protein